MNKTRFWAIGIAILFPLSFYFFFKFKYGHPEIDYPKKMYPMGMVDTFYRGTDVVVDSVYHTIPQFEVTTQLGTSFTAEDLKERISVIGMFMPNTPEADAMMEAFKSIQDDFIRDDNLQLIQIDMSSTADVEDLRKHARSANAVPGKYYVVSGETEDLKSLIAKGLKMSFVEDSTGHRSFSDRLVIVDDELNLRGYYDVLEGDTMVLRELKSDIVLVNKRQR